MLPTCGYSETDDLECGSTETVNGISNWKLTVLRNSCGVVVLRAVTCDSIAVLPEELFGLPVVALADRALAPGAPELDGERVDIVCGRAEGEFNNRNITELTLPRTLKSVGQYALMNCAKLRRLRLFDNITDFATSALMNCRSFHELELSRETGIQGPILSSIVSYLPRELDVTVREADGSVLRLIFPEYVELLVENEPTHFFNYIIESAGYPYHNVFRDRRFSVQDFDALWDKCLSMEHDKSAALRLAWWRLRCPTGLSPEARSAYTRYLSVQLREAMELALIERDIAGLEMLLSDCSPSTEDIEFGQSRARELRYTEAVAVLLERQHRSRNRGRHRSFEL